MKSVLFSVAVIAVLSSGTAHSQELRQKVIELGNKSKCAKTDWKNRGIAPKAFIRGTAMVFAKAVCNVKTAEAKLVAAGIEGAPPKNKKFDALVWLDPEFKSVALSNANDGLDTLRHAYTLMYGLGMMESSGQHCVGRDKSADFSTSDSAEASLYQTSWGVNKKNNLLSEMFEHYKSNPKNCLLDMFSKNVNCSAWDAKTWGSGDGAEWQKLTKSCPAFSTEYAAIVLRVSGGEKGEYGPIRKKKVEIIPACDSFLKEVQSLVTAKPDLCGEFN